MSGTHFRPSEPSTVNSINEWSSVFFMRFSLFLRFDRLDAAAVEAMRLDVGRLRLQPLPGGMAVGADGLEPHADLGEVDARRTSRVGQRGQRFEEEQLRDVASGVGRVENRLVERSSELCIELRWL